MSNKATPYSKVVKDLMRKKSNVLSKAEALFEIGMVETTQRLFVTAAAYEERIAALLDTEGQELDAAIHRISAASCYKKAGHLSRAVNLYRAALSGPLHDDTRADVLVLLKRCLEQLARQPALSGTAPSMPEIIIAA